MMIDRSSVFALGLTCRAVVLAAATLAAGLLPSVVQAQSVWGGSGGTTTTQDYNLGTNWSNPPGGSPTAAGQSAIFAGTGNSSVVVTAGPIAPDSWIFNANSQSYTVTGASANFGGNVTNNASAGQAISIANNLQGATLNQAGSSILTLSGADSFATTNVTGGTLALSGSGSLGASAGVALGSGTFDISQTAAGVSVQSIADNGNGSMATVSLGHQTLTIANSGGVNSGSFSGTIADGGIGGGAGGSLSLTGGTLVLSGANTYTGATTVNFSTLELSGSGSIANSSLVILNNFAELDFSFATGPSSVKGLAGDSTTLVTLGGNTLTITNGSSTYFGNIADGGINECFICIGSIAITGGTQTFAGANRYSGGTTIYAGTLAISGGGTLGASSGSTTILGGVLDLGGTTDVVQASLTQSGGTVRNGTLTLSGTYNLSAGTLAADATIVASEFDVSAGTVNGILSGSGTLFKTGPGTLTLAGANSYSGGTSVTGGTIAIGNSLAFGTGDVALGDGTVLAFLTSGLTLANNFRLGGADPTIDSGAGTDTMAGVISGPAALTKIGAGTLILSGNNTYTGATVIAAGTLDVTGSIAASSLTTANSGALLTGTGTVGNALIASGGAFLPGNGTPGSSMAVSGNLAFQSGALFLVQVNPATASFASVTGAATLGGATVSATFANGSYIAKQYTILIGAAGVSGAFGSLVNTNLPSGFTDSLSYDPTHAYLNLALTFGTPSGLNVNQQNVANALTNFFNGNGGIPAVFGALTPAGLTQASGELATGAQRATFDAMNLFMGVMTDPFMAGRCENVMRDPQPAGFSDGTIPGDCAIEPRDRGVRDANAALYTKAAPAAVGFDPRWRVWAAGYGGSETTSGNAALGSNTETSRVYGTAVGADYRISPNTLAGFAMAGGGTNFSVANGGSGRSDLFQAGAYLRHTAGAAYISGALAYGWQDITTDRTVTIAGVDRLHAGFDANALSGRIEGGYRLVTRWTNGIGITPYAAARFTTVDLPAYAEQVLSGTNTFALAYGAKNATDARIELGIRADKSFAMANGVLTLRGRAAWAHDYDPDRAITATFLTLPGASFTVNGAAQAADAALTTASVEMKWMNGWSAAGTFEGEFSNVTTSYAGKGVVRYQW
jgi:autotransporter-associated beta strand protein